MSVHIEAQGGRVLIKADDGSHVSNISVAGEQYLCNAGKTRGPWLTRLQKLELVFASVIAVCIAIFCAMILGVKI